MQIAENRWKFTVDSKLLWNDSGVPLLAGVSYQIEPMPGSFWYDSIFKSGPQGYRNFYVDWFHGWLRVPQVEGTRAEFFELIGAPAPDVSQAFIIGASTTYTPSHDGQLFAFANDVKGFYCNNRGSMEVVVTRL